MEYGISSSRHLMSGSLFGALVLVLVLLHGTTTKSSTQQQWIWDNVPHVQTMFSEDRIFIVPEGVTKVDVICIGGGGGGRDGHSLIGATEFGGNGGDSLFGPYLVAGGGKGAKEDNTGGEGGHGTVADGGQGGIGGACSAGAGAAGQTSGGGGGLVAGSSTYPFCGGGGSSGGSSCGNEFAAIPPGKSGPGGIDPNGRAGGLYGGGGGSRAGGRAGGGGGLPRDVINVKPRQRIPIAVGQRGTPYYRGGRSAPGIVVISWGGPIDYPTIVVDTTTLSSEAILCTTSSPTPATSLPRKECRWVSICSGGSRHGASCVNGLCQCSAAGYNKYTCLPDVGSCRILPNQRDAMGISTFRGKIQETNSCIGSSTNSPYEVHVLGNYENVSHRPPSPGRTNVYIRGQSQKPVVLVVSSYEPVTWVINADVSVNLQMILLYSFYDTLSSIDLVQLANRARITTEKSRRSSATGDDSGGGDTAGLLKLLTDRFGEVTSFTGSYKADNWELRLTAILCTASPPTPATSGGGAGRDGQSKFTSTAGLSTGSIIGIVVGVIILSICLGCCICIYRCRKSSGSPRSTNTAAYFVPQTSAHHSTTTMPQNQPLQTIHHCTTGQPSTGSDPSYSHPQYSIHNNGQPPTNSNTTYPGSHYLGYAVGGHQPVAQSYAPSVNNPDVSVPQPGTTRSQPSASPMYQTIPASSDTTAPPPSYDSLYPGDN